MTLPLTHPLVVGLAFAFGACIGSFLNVIIYRLPLETSIVHPRSSCPHCRHLIAWHDNIPLLSYLWLRGRCRHCHHPIVFRYFLVELLTGVLFVSLLWWAGWSVHVAVAWALTACLIASTFIDLDYRIIPDEITLSGIVIGLAASALFPAIHGVGTWWQGLRQSLLGVLVGGGSLYLTGLLGNAVFRKESMGMGDVKLLAMAGAVLGWKLVLVAFFLAPILALIPGLIVMATTKSHEIPYGPFLSLALLVSMVSGEEILRQTGIMQALDIGMPEVWRLLRSWGSTS